LLFIQFGCANLPLTHFRFYLFLLPETQILCLRMRFTHLRFYLFLLPIACDSHSLYSLALYSLALYSPALYLYSHPRNSHPRTCTLYLLAADAGDDVINSAHPRILASAHSLQGLTTSYQAGYSYQDICHKNATPDTSSLRFLPIRSDFY